jgi:hypothetical protein
VTQLYHGVAGALNATFGAPCTHTDAAGQTRQVQGVLRRTPIEVAEADGGAVLIVAPTLRVPAPDAAGIQRDDKIEQGAHRYAVLNRIATANPSADRFVVFELEDVS